MLETTAMTITDSTTPFFTQAAKTAGLAILNEAQGTDSLGRPTYIYRFGTTSDATQQHTLTMELSEGFQIAAPQMPKRQSACAIRGRKHTSPWRACPSP
jgi:hypothetical protein